MSRSPRTPLLALTFAIVALAAAGCGGGEVSAEEVPGAPPALVVPTDSALGSGGASSSDGSTGTDGTDSGADTGTADSGTTTTPEDTSGGTAAPETDNAPAPEDTTTEPEQPPAGSAPEQFESFCEQNAGAC